MFFRKKSKDAAKIAAEIKTALEEETVSVKGTTPELVEITEASATSTPAEETVEADAALPRNGATTLSVAGDDMIRLFPGFERDDFEVGFRADRSLPALVMRWKDGGEWFPVPPLFNRAVLASMDERDSASDLNRLLRNYGYDVEAIAE